MIDIAEVDAFEEADVLEEASGTARPARIEFCSSWSLQGDGLEIMDPFDRIEVTRFPLSIDETEPLVCVVFWEGLGRCEKPRLEIAAPSGRSFKVVLPSLKPFVSMQVQMNALTGFTFPEPGRYIFSVSSETGVMEKGLELMPGSPAVHDIER